MERVGRFLGRAALQLSHTVDSSTVKVSTPLGTAAEKVVSAALTAGGAILFRWSTDFGDHSSNDYTVGGGGEKGQYEVKVGLEMTPVNNGHAEEAKQKQEDEPPTDRREETTQ